MNRSYIRIYQCFQRECAVEDKITWTGSELRKKKKNKTKKTKFLHAFRDFIEHFPSRECALCYKLPDNQEHSIKPSFLHPQFIHQSSSSTF